MLPLLVADSVFEETSVHQQPVRKVAVGKERSDLTDLDPNVVRSAIPHRAAAVLR